MAIKKKVARQTETAPLKWAEAQTLLKLLKADDKHETRLMFAIGFYTGLRISDILRLTWGQITSGTEVTVIEKKTGKSRRIQINPDLALIIKEARKWAAERGGVPAAAEHLFTSKRGPSIGSPLTVMGANIRIRETLEEYGIKTQNSSSHCLRKTFARRVYEANGRTEDALILLSQILNHTGPAMTRKYIGLTREVVAEAYMNLWVTNE